MTNEETLRAEVDRLRGALEEIANHRVADFDWPAEEWAKHTPETCAECKRWQEMKHPLQHRCDGWYRLLHSREDRNSRANGEADMRQIAIAALAASPASPKENAGAPVSGFYWAKDPNYPTWAVYCYLCGVFYPCAPNRMASNLSRADVTEFVGPIPNPDSVSKESLHTEPAAPSAELLSAVRDVLTDGIELTDIQLRGGIADDGLVPILTEMCERKGYGNVISTVSRLWRNKDGFGAFSVGHCFAVVRDFRAKLAALDRLMGNS